MLRLTNIVLADGKTIPEIEIDDGKKAIEERDMGNLLAVPGFIDSHIHGSFGLDVSDGKADDIVSLASRLPEFGVSDFLPTLMSLDEKSILKAAEAVSEASEKLSQCEGPYASISGLRLEGPFLSSSRSGVQNSDNLVSADEFASILEKVENTCPGLIRMIDIAPELEGAMELVREYKDKYVISLAHSDCDYKKAAEFFKNGGNSLTHALNAMKPCLNREPGPLGAAYDDSDSYIEVICDGIHVDPTVLRMLFGLFEGRIIVISDAMRAGGMPDGIYDLGGTAVESRGGRTYFGPSGNLAGSVSNLSQEAERLFSYGIGKTNIIKALTDTPAKRLGIRSGIVPGEQNCHINFVDQKLRLKCVISRGRLVSSFIML